MYPPSKKVVAMTILGANKRHRLSHCQSEKKIYELGKYKQTTITNALTIKCNIAKGYNKHLLLEIGVTTTSK